MSDRLFIVMLRRPRTNDPRTDPFWEFGSFGCTGCHGKNLLHPMKCQVRTGDRLVFVQGGHLGSRLLLVTPLVQRVDHPGGSPKGRVELRWDSGQKPFRYAHAPDLFELASPRAPVLFPLLTANITGANRGTMDAKFASRFRACIHPLEPELALELETAFNMAVKSAAPSDFIIRYQDALPWCDCPHTPDQRCADYQNCLKELEQSFGATPATHCRK